MKWSEITDFETLVREVLKRYYAAEIQDAETAIGIINDYLVEKKAH